jgi:hypothetical protein
MARISSLRFSQDEVVFRTKDARALRNLCRRLRWQIAIDTTLSTDDWTWPPEGGSGARPPAKRS